MGAPTHDGGKPNVKSLPYSEPKGPTQQHRNATGLGGENYGNSGTQGPKATPARESGSPGIGGTNHGKDPS